MNVDIINSFDEKEVILCKKCGSRYFWERRCVGFALSNSGDKISTDIQIEKPYYTCANCAYPLDLKEWKYE